jgi:hypothetical protein
VRVSGRLLHASEHRCRCEPGGPRSWTYFTAILLGEQVTTRDRKRWPDLSGRRGTLEAARLPVPRPLTGGRVDDAEQGHNRHAGARRPRRHGGRRPEPQGARQLCHERRDAHQLRRRRHPWGTWITCEEDRTTSHGYCYEVMWNDPENNLSKTPILDMGFFSHEALDVDPRTGIVYLTEDDFRGAIPPDPRTEIDGDPAFRSSFLFRYLPNDRSARPGSLLVGGTLQALAIDSAPRNADLYSPWGA